MEFNDFQRIFNFDPLRYEGQLSTFGKKVLNELVKKWDRDKIRSDSMPRNYNKLTPTIRNTSRKVLTLRKNRTDLKNLPPLESYIIPDEQSLYNIFKKIGISIKISIMKTQGVRKTPFFAYIPALRIHLTNVLQLYSGHQFSTKNFNTYESPIVRSPTMEDAITYTDSLQAPVSIINNNTLHNGPPNVPSYNELVHTFDSPRNNDNLITHDLLLNTVNSKQDINEPVLTINNNGYGSKQTIDWDNMFDTELLSDIDMHTKFCKNENNFNNNSDLDTPCLINDAKEINFKIPTIPPKTREEQKIKRKTQTKITDVVPKKVKKITTDGKNSLRKQKYSKTVKNWLDDVDPNNPVEEDSIKNVTESNNSLDKEDEEKNTIFNKVIEKNKPSTVKKVVQAQLANKGGIMKYSKPKNLGDASNDVGPTNSKSSDTDAKNKRDIAAKPKTITDTSDKTGSSDSENKKNNKEKKPKPKFIAPIKSQIPVKDISYEIINLDNSDRNLKLLNKYVKDTEIIVVLIYSNGFSQLNMHHTEDSCEPEGLLLYIGDTFYYFKGYKESYNEILKQILEKNTIVCFNGKHILIYLKSHYNLDTHNLTTIDLQIGGSILESDSNIETYAELQKVLSYTPEYTIATECYLQKTSWYITTLKECHIKLVQLLKEDDLWSVFVKIEMKLLPIIADMESQGVKVDVTKLKSMEDTILTKMKVVEQKCYKAAGKTFQINSTVQVRTIIYDELGLDSKCNVKIRETICQGAKSTSEAMLRSLISVHPLPKLILEYRHLQKAHATFLTGIAQHVRDGVVKPTWVQTAAVTGRIASNNPNLQAIPKSPFCLSLFPETDDESDESLLFRSVYTSERGWSVLACDFQHVECRVWAHIANDDKLLAALAGDTDFFIQLAIHWLKKPESEISSEDRERTKRMVYATLYGAGCRKLMDILNLSYEQTLTAIASFNRTFPSLKSFGAGVVARCGAAGGRLRSAGGRHRALPHIHSHRLALRAQAERQAVNFVIQGSAADLCKLAMVRSVERLRQAKVEHRLVLQIHDELVFHVPNEQLDIAAGTIKQAMESCGSECGMCVSLPVAVGAGTDWAHLTPYKPPSTI